MKLRWRGAVCLALCILLVWFLRDAAGVRASAAEALSLCARSVIPALFPFMAVSSLLLRLGFGEMAAPHLSGLMEPLFRVPGEGSAALLLGLVGGYPIGAKTAADLYRQQALSKGEAERLLAFANTSNPVFLISVLGAGVFGSVRTGVWLWLIHLLAALLTGLLFRRWGRETVRRAGGRPQVAEPVSLPTAFVASIASALGGILSVCAFVTFFYVLAKPFTAIAAPWGAAVVGALELFSLTPLLAPDAAGFITAAGITGWGGVSVLCQTVASLEGSGLSPLPCLLGKVCHGLLSAGLAAALAGYVLG